MLGWILYPILSTEYVQLLVFKLYAYTTFKTAHSCAMQSLHDFCDLVIHKFLKKDFLVCGCNFLLLPRNFSKPNKRTGECMLQGDTTGIILC